MADENAALAGPEGEGSRAKYLSRPADMGELLGYLERLERENAELRVQIRALRRENDLLVFTPSDEDRRRETEVEQHVLTGHLRRIAALEAELAELHADLYDDDSAA